VTSPQRFASPSVQRPSRGALFRAKAVGRFRLILDGGASDAWAPLRRRWRRHQEPPAPSAPRDRKFTTRPPGRTPAASRASANANTRRAQRTDDRLTWPVRETISLIDSRLTKYRRRISAHCSTPTTTSSSLDHHRPSEAHDPGRRRLWRRSVSFQPASGRRYLTGVEDALGISDMSPHTAKTIAAASAPLDYFLRAPSRRSDDCERLPTV
jgi:hypothetical protein